MKELVFQVELKSDIVLPASSNTEGKINQLDFIAGSNFLGMVAKNYDKFASSFDVFHSGKVRFGDGHILKDAKMTYKMPLSIFKEKTDENILVNQLHTSLDTLKQAQQLRNGYITKELDEVFVNYTYSQKSAYDKNTRTSKEGQMYGYTALKKGSVWQFTVKVDGVTTEDEKLIIKTLQESKRLGKSKSAEYGEVKITYLENQSRENINDKNPKLDEVVLYCNSRLALVDKCGNPTYDLKYLCEGVEINYEKTQIRTSTFTPYNGKRQIKDYERVCINKGSVIVLNNPSSEQIKKIQNGVGAFLSEGFGEIIINPKFLRQKEFSLKKECKDKKEIDKRQKIAEIFENTTIQFLANRHNQNIDMLDIANEVARFIVENPPKEKLNSQWGAIRALTNQAKTEKELYDLIFERSPEDKPKGFLRSKKAKDKWGENLIGNIEATKKMCEEKELDFIKFIKLLLIQMPKQKMGGKND